MWPLSKNQPSKTNGYSETNGSSKKPITQPSSKPSAPSQSPMPLYPPSAKPGSSSGIPIPQTTTPTHTIPGRTPPPSTHPPLSQRHQQYPPEPPPLQEQQQEEQLLEQRPPRPHTPLKKRISGDSTRSKRTSGAKTPTTPGRGHNYTSSGGSNGSTTGFGRWGRRGLPSPPDSLVENSDAGPSAQPGERRSWGTGAPGERRSWGAAGTGGLGVAGGAGLASEQRRSWGGGNGERGIGRVAARIKAAVLGREGEEGVDKVGRRRKGGSVEGSLGGSKPGSLGGSRGASASGSKVASQVGSKVGSQVGSLGGRGGGEEEGKRKSGASSEAVSPTGSPSDSDGGEPEPKRGWTDRVKGRKKRSSRWRAKKVNEDVMPPGMVPGTGGLANRPWGRRAIWGRRATRKGEEGEEKKKKVGGFVTMLDASPAPIRLPSHEKVSRRSEELEGGEEEVKEEAKGKEAEDEEWEEGEEEDEWDEDSLVQLSDWWRQMLGRGKDPTWQELDMIFAFLSDLYEEDTPSLEMILTTRLHKLLEALIKADGEQGLRYEGKRYHKIAHKATEIKDKWMDDMDGHLYDMRSEQRKMLKGENGRLSRVHMRPVGEHSSRWVVEGHAVEEGIEFEPGMWWLNDACAERDGMLTDTRGNVSESSQSVPVVTLAFGEEMPTQKPTITRFTHSGRIETMMVPLMRALDKRVQVLRRYTLKSRLAPEAGLRYDGFYDIVMYSFQRLSWDESIFRVVVEFERCMGQRPMDTVLAVPTPSMLDDWDIYQEIKDDSVRRSVGEAWYRESLSKEKEEERDRVSWHQVRADEERRRAEEDKRREKEEQRRAQEDARRAVEDEKREAQMKKAERELQYLEEQERIAAEKGEEEESEEG